MFLPVLVIFSSNTLLTNTYYLKTHDFSNVKQEKVWGCSDRKLHNPHYLFLANIISKKYAMKYDCSGFRWKA
jgi:hypothetical protein